MKKILIDLSLIEDYDLSADAFSVYCAIKRGKSNIERSEYINTNIIGYWMYDKAIDRNERNGIKKGLDELIEKELIKERYRINDFESVYDTSLIEVNDDSSKYTFIYSDDVIKIMNLPYSFNEGLLLCYVYIMHTTLKSNIEEKYIGKISFVNIDTLSFYLNTNVKTISKYIDCLFKSEIIYVVKCYNTVISNNNGRKYGIKNIYCKYENKKYVDDFIKSHDGVSIPKNKVFIANESRAAIQKYNWMLKGKKYPDQEIETIYAILKEWNKEKEEEWLKSGHHGEKPKLKDLSIFKKYGLEE